MGEDIILKSYVVQLFNKTETSDSLIQSLKHFMFDDKRNPLYLHVMENTIFIYSIHEYWNMNSLSMIIRSHLMGDYFIIYEIDEYDGLLPSTVWEKKKDAIKYYNDKETILSKYKRHYLINKVKRKSFAADMSNSEPTAEDLYEQEVKKKVVEKKISAKEYDEELEAISKIVCKE